MRDISDGQESLQATATADTHIQKLDLEARQASGMVTEDAYMAWFNLDAPVEEGDNLTDAEGNRYLVKEIAKADFGSNQHLEVVLVKFNA